MKFHAAIILMVMIEGIALCGGKPYSYYKKETIEKREPCEDDKKDANATDTHEAVLDFVDKAISLKTNLVIDTLNAIVNAKSEFLKSIDEAKIELLRKLIRKQLAKSDGEKSKTNTPRITTVPPPTTVRPTVHKKITVNPSFLTGATAPDKDKKIEATTRSVKLAETAAEPSVPESDGLIRDTWKKPDVPTRATTQPSTPDSMPTKHSPLPNFVTANEDKDEKTAVRSTVNEEGRTVTEPSTFKPETTNYSTGHSVSTDVNYSEQTTSESVISHATSSSVPGSGTSFNDQDDRGATTLASEDENTSVSTKFNREEQITAIPSVPDMKQNNYSHFSNSGMSINADERIKASIHFSREEQDATESPVSYLTTAPDPDTPFTDIVDTTGATVNLARSTKRSSDSESIKSSAAPNTDKPFGMLENTDSSVYAAGTDETSARSSSVTDSVAKARSPATPLPDTGSSIVDTDENFSVSAEFDREEKLIDEPSTGHPPASGTSLPDTDERTGIVTEFENKEYETTVPSAIDVESTTHSTDVDISFADTYEQASTTMTFGQGKLATTEPSVSNMESTEYGAYSNTGTSFTDPDESTVITTDITDKEHPTTEPSDFYSERTMRGTLSSIGTSLAAKDRKTEAATKFSQGEHATTESSVIDADPTERASHPDAGISFTDESTDAAADVTQKVDPTTEPSDVDSEPTTRGTLSSVGTPFAAQDVRTDAATKFSQGEHATTESSVIDADPTERASHPDAGISFTDESTGAATDAAQKEHAPTESSVVDADPTERTSFPDAGISFIDMGESTGAPTDVTQKERATTEPSDVESEPTMRGTLSSIGTPFAANDERTDAATKFSEEERATTESSVPGIEPTKYSLIPDVGVSSVDADESVTILIDSSGTDRTSEKSIIPYSKSITHSPLPGTDFSFDAHRGTSVSTDFNEEIRHTAESFASDLETTESSPSPGIDTSFVDTRANRTEESSTKSPIRDLESTRGTYGPYPNTGVSFDDEDSVAVSASNLDEEERIDTEPSISYVESTKYSFRSNAAESHVYEDAETSIVKEFSEIGQITTDDPVSTVNPNNYGSQSAGSIDADKNFSKVVPMITESPVTDSVPIKYNPNETLPEINITIDDTDTTNEKTTVIVTTGQTTTPKPTTGPTKFNLLPGDDVAVYDKDGAITVEENNFESRTPPSESEKSPVRPGTVISLDGTIPKNGFLALFNQFNVNNNGTILVYPNIHYNLVNNGVVAMYPNIEVNNGSSSNISMSPASRGKRC